jgi:hypothetical protein
LPIKHITQLLSISARNTLTFFLHYIFKPSEPEVLLSVAARAFRWSQTLNVRYVKFTVGLQCPILLKTVKGWEKYGYAKLLARTEKPMLGWAICENNPRHYLSWILSEGLAFVQALQDEKTNCS